MTTVCHIGLVGILKVPVQGEKKRNDGRSAATS